MFEPLRKLGLDRDIARWPIASILNRDVKLDLLTLEHLGDGRVGDDVHLELGLEYPSSRLAAGLETNGGGMVKGAGLDGCHRDRDHSIRTTRQRGEAPNQMLATAGQFHLGHARDELEALGE